MGLRKDDPVYYKQKLNDLFKQAWSKGLTVQVKHIKDGVRISFIADNGDIAGVELIDND